MVVTWVSNDNDVDLRYGKMTEVSSDNDVDLKYGFQTIMMWV
jgi:hypothetical protein